MALCALTVCEMFSEPNVRGVKNADCHLMVNLPRQPLASIAWIWNGILMVRDLYLRLRDWFVR